MEKGGVAQEVSAFEGDGVGHRGIDTKGEVATYFFDVLLAENIPVFYFTVVGVMGCYIFPIVANYGGGEV